MMLTEFYLWGFVKDHVYQPLLPRNVDELKVRINAAVTQTTSETLQKVWDKAEVVELLCNTPITYKVYKHKAMHSPFSSSS
jgi:hypothetical protein